MDEMDVMEEPEAIHPETNEQKKKKNKKGIAFDSQICRFEMSEWPREASTGGVQIVRRVAVYVEGTGKLWIDKNDLEWLPRTLFIQQQIKGVSAVASDDEGPDAHVNMEAVMTPEKRPQRQQCDGYLHDKWGSAPF